MSSLLFEPAPTTAVERRRARGRSAAARPQPLTDGQPQLVRVQSSVREPSLPCPPAQTVLDESDRFLRRAVALMAGRGVRQFIKVDRGLAAGRDVHRILDGVGDARMVVVDNNPMMLALARTRRRTDVAPRARVEYLRADLADPGSLLRAPHLRVLDLSAPVGLLLGSVLHLVPDAENPHAAVDRLVRELAPGSYLAVSHLTGDRPSPALEAALQVYRRCGVPAQLRSRSQIERFFTGLELIEPGIELASRWRRGPDDPPPPPPDRVACLAGVGRVPVTSCS